MMVKHSGFLCPGRALKLCGHEPCICSAGHFGTSWVKHYCTYQRESKRITMVPFDQKSGGKGVSAGREHVALLAAGSQTVSPFWQGDTNAVKWVMFIPG